MDPHSRAPKKNTSHANEVLPKDTTHLTRRVTPGLVKNKQTNKQTNNNVVYQMRVKPTDEKVTGMRFIIVRFFERFRVLESELCVLTFIQCPFHPGVTAVARKQFRSFCQKCRWQVDPSSRSVPTMPLPRHSVEIYQETSPHAIRQGTIGHSRLSSPTTVD